MAFGGLSASTDSQELAEINMIPLIDVMLVLLVIFIITAPLLTHAVKINLPTASSTSNPPRADTVQLSIDGSGQLYWNTENIDAGALQARMADAARQIPQPEIHIRADGGLAYRKVASVMADAAAAGLSKLGFVTDPHPAR
jgi:outer membrane transport energization protein ExbD (TC 2.C.1.1.1)